MLVSYNIQNGVYADSIVRNIGHMQKNGVGIFCVQEAREIESDFVGDRLEQELGDKWQGEYYLGTNNPRIDLGLGILWNSTSVQLQELERVPLPKLKELSLIERQVTSTPQPPQRGAIVATFNVNGYPLRVANVHLDWQSGVSQRMTQLEYLVSHLKQKPAISREIICGDFNTTGRQDSARKQQEKMQRILGVNFTEVFPELKWTSDGGTIDPKRGFSKVQRLLVGLGIRFHQRLDYIYVKGVDVADAKMEKVKGSDHFPLVVTLNL